MRTLRTLAQRPLTVIGMALTLIFILAALFGPNVAPYPFDDFVRDSTGSVARRVPPGSEFLFGTDRLGRDVFSRILWGARDVIGVAGLATTMSVVLGTAIGLAIGYRGGWIDEFISRGFDSLLAIPAMVLALVMLATIGPSSWGIVVVIVLLYTPIVTRVIRSATLG